MSDTPKFEVIDRRKYKAAEEEQESSRLESREPVATMPEPTPAPKGAAQTQPKAAEARAAEQKAAEQRAAQHEPGRGPQLVTSDPDAAENEHVEDALGGYAAMPPAPTAEESREQKSAYDASSQRLEDLVRAQNPAAGPQPPVSFEQLVQQFYLSAMIQMGAGTQEGQRPRVDILGAKQTIDLLGILAEKTKGNLTPAEDRMLQAVLFEARMAFLELTNMITMPAVPTPPPTAPGKR